MQLPVDDLPLSERPSLDLLESTTILDLTGSIAGPYAGQMLADLGATVIKIERPSAGDDSRAWGPPFLDGQSLWYLSVNRNKLAVTLNIATDLGRSMFERLVARSDVVLVNLIGATQQKLGLDATTLRAINPALIHASITGFGLTGERAGLLCYDLIAEGYSGVMDMTGERHGPPQKIGAPAADLLAGQDAALAIVAALLRRGRSGEGCAIDVSLVESMTRFMAPRLSCYLGSGEAPRRSGGRDSVIAIYQTFETRDEPLTLALGNDVIWRRFWEVVEAPEGLSEMFPTNAQRRANREHIVTRIAGILQQRGRDEWLEAFAAAGIPAGPIFRIDEVAHDPALRARGLFYACPSQAGLVPQVGLGITFDGRGQGTTRPPPSPGEHNSLVWEQWLGIDDAQLRDLTRSGVI